MRNHRSNSFIWLFAGVSAGAVAGIVAGILCAPRSGDQTRQLLHSQARKQRERLHQHANRIRERATEWAVHNRDFLMRRNKSRPEGNSTPKAVGASRDAAGTVARATEDIAS